MQRIFSVWKNESSRGNVYYTGKLGDLKIIGFENEKENEKQPDITFYVQEEKNFKQENNKTITKKEEDKNDPYEDFGNKISIDNDFLD